MDIGTVGIWRPAPFLTGEPGPETAAELDRLGFGALWVGTSPSGDLRLAEDLLAASDRIVVATGVVNIWSAPARVVAASFHRLETRFPGRFLLGVGVGHPEATGADYARPLAALESYLDDLDAAPQPVPAHRRVLAALGPKVLDLAARRTAGGHPYLTTVEHTRTAREALGPGPLLAPELMVVLDPDPDSARALARRRLARPYLQLRNYVANLRRLGFDDADLADGGSDRLVDALVARGDEEAVATRVREHLDAGADHVCLQLLAPRGSDELGMYRRLAGALVG